MLGDKGHRRGQGGTASDRPESAEVSILDSHQAAGVALYIKVLSIIEQVRRNPAITLLCS